MYEHYFGLKRKPFELAPNPDFLYLGAAHKKAITYLNYTVQEKAGFLLLTGEVGSGKTTLIRDFVNKLDDRASLAKVFNTKVNFEQLIAMINDDFGLDTTGKDKVALLKDLYRFLVDEHGKGRTPILIIDEAQNFSPAVLEEIRLLSNLETAESKLLQIILVAQPELAGTLALPELRQLRQRVSIACHISPLTRQDSEEYIFHRLAVAGNRDAVKIAPEAMDGIYDFSSGTPRLLNIICNFLMLTAFTEGVHAINREMVDDIVRELQSGTAPEITSEQTTGKRVLLQALRTPATNEERSEAATQNIDSLESGKKVLLLLKDLSLRMSALEKQQARYQSKEFEDMKNRLERLESAGKQSKSIEQSPVAAPASPKKDRGAVQAAVVLPELKKGEDLKKGLLKRIVNALS